MNQHGPKAELGDFLRSRRARIRPEDAGLRSFGGRRRVPGLRREELAQLAGVSADYYTRFEQGRAENVSDGILGAVVAALRLDAAEAAHLTRLVRNAGPGGAAAARARGREADEAQEVRPGLRRLLESMPGTPAFVLGRRTDILAWNPLFATLITDFAALAPERRNKAWLVFLHPEVRGRFVNWETKARDLVAYLRFDLGRHPGDPRFAELIAELAEHSAEFTRLWEEREVGEKTHGGYHLRHPLVGELALAYESLVLPDDPDQTLITYTAEAGSPSDAALRILAGAAANTSAAATGASAAHTSTGASADAPAAPAAPRA
ncbi:MULTISPECIES: helix-turn-helix transcriptional regulator [unclassified Streptomyces]|uniref:helix-turn-helix transcriptional regulator n=1 Tax=unclassified Streptomyces TaxID=2593676 RepID=UPI000DC79758|nr:MULTISPECIES: helix-turn-helix transcriptional regulator [unclassified Streptomyces]AWZ07669.1 transcriptional regulator [Streptomyces sp. ICC4]AWZ15337.1 transcriptional regulator [Streptomyces sp. ICC1]